MSRHRINNNLVLECIQDLFTAEKLVTRELLAKTLNVSPMTADHHIKNLIGQGKLRRIRPGLFAPMLVHPPSRAITATLFPDGFVKLEIGNDILELTPREARMVGRALSGHLIEFSQSNQTA